MKKRSMLLVALAGALLLGPTVASAESVCVDAGATGLLPATVQEHIQDVHAALRDGGVVLDPVCVPIP